MVSRRRDDDRRVLPWAFVLSSILHAILLPLALWWAWQRLPLTMVQQKPEVLVIQSSAVHFERQVHPVTKTIAPKLPKHEEPPATQPEKHPEPALAQPPRHELAVLVPKAPAQPHAPGMSTLAGQLALQERQFARTAAQLHAANNPLGVTESAAAPSSLHRSYFDTKPAPNGYYAILIPTKHWFDGDRSCYYTNYHTQFDGGGNEDGSIPWPICYPRNNDKMLPLDHPHSLPVPVPPAEFMLPADTYLTPFLKDIYDQRDSHG